jgi:hypothetical protein
MNFAETVIVTWGFLLSRHLEVTESNINYLKKKDWRPILSS